MKIAKMNFFYDFMLNYGKKRVREGLHLIMNYYVIIIINFIYFNFLQY